MPDSYFPCSQGRGTDWCGGHAACIAFACFGSGWSSVGSFGGHPNLRQHGDRQGGQGRGFSRLEDNFMGVYNLRYHMSITSACSAVHAQKPAVRLSELKIGSANETYTVPEAAYRLHIYALM